MPKRKEDDKDKDTTAAATTPQTDDAIFEHTGATVAPTTTGAIDTADPALATVEDERTPIDPQLAPIDDTAAAQRAMDFSELPAISGYTGVNHGGDTADTGNEGDGAFFLDLSKPDEPIKPMPIGTRAVVSCKGAEAKVSSAGNAMLVLRVQVQRVRLAQGASAEEIKTYDKRTVKDNVMFIPPNPVTGSRGTIWRAQQAFAAFGVPWPAQQFRSQAEFMAVLTELAQAFIGAVAVTEFGIEASDPNNINAETGEPWPPKNTVTRYSKFVPEAGALPRNVPVQIGAVPRAVDNDEDLPF